MSNKLTILEEREVLGRVFRIYGDKENPLFLAKDVAEWIDYNKTKQGWYDVSAMLRVIDEDEKIKIRTTINNPSGSEMWFLTEDGLYEVLMQSRKEIAKSFKKEVKKILKQIRLTGGAVTNENKFIEMYFPSFSENVKKAMVLDLQSQNEKYKEKCDALHKNVMIQKEIIDELKPKAELFDNAIDTKGLYKVSHIAQEFGMTAYALNLLLHNQHIQYKKGGIWILYKKYLPEGYVATRATFTHPNGTEIKYTYWTEKGRVFIHQLLASLGKNPLTCIEEKYEQLKM